MIIYLQYTKIRGENGVVADNVYASDIYILNNTRLY